MSVERFHLKALPVREFCAKFCDGTVLFCSVTERAPGLPDHSSTLILPRGGSPLAVPHLCDPQYYCPVRIQITTRRLFASFMHYMLPEHICQYKPPNVYQLKLEIRLSISF